MDNLGSGQKARPFYWDTTMNTPTLDDFTKAYVDCALWASNDDTNPDVGDNPLDDNYFWTDIDSSTLQEMIEDCLKFQKQNADLINNDNSINRTNFSPEEHAGHDFWLTRNRHGCGFWDGDWREPAASKLTESSKSFGDYNITASGKGGQVYKM